VAQAFNLAIQPTLKTKDTKIIAGIAAFVENSDIMRKELEKRALRAAITVAPERAGGLKKAIEITNSNPLGYTLGVSNNIVSGVAAVRYTEKSKVKGRYSESSPESAFPKSLRPKYITKPDRFSVSPPLSVNREYGPFRFNIYRDISIDDGVNMFRKKSRKQYEKEMKRYRLALARERRRVQRLRKEYTNKTKTKTVSFQKSSRYVPYRDGGSKVRANMQEFGYPYKTKYWGPYKPNPKAPKGPEGMGYLRLGQVLAVKSLTKDTINYSVKVSEEEVVRYEKTIENEMSKAYSVLLAKFLRNQKLPAYYAGIDKLKKPAPIPERAKAYGNVSNFNLEVPLAFPSNKYSNLQSGRKLANISRSVTGRDFEPGSYFLIEDPLPF
jgi:hypothetical protein